MFSRGEVFGDGPPRQAATKDGLAAKDHKENKQSQFLSMRSLHCNPSESRMVARIFFRAESAESAEKKQERRSAMQSFSAPSAPLRAPVPSGRDLVRACTQCQTVRLLLEQDAWDRRKQREQSITGDCPSPRFLCCLLFESSVWLRLAALCSFAAKILPKMKRFFEFAI
jgi:hypothetical protein